MNTPRNDLLSRSAFAIIAGLFLSSPLATLVLPIGSTAWIVVVATASLVFFAATFWWSPISSCLDTDDPMVRQGRIESMHGLFNSLGVDLN